LKIDEAYGVGFKDFIHLCKKAGQEQVRILTGNGFQGLMTIKSKEDPEEDSVPLVILKKFASDFIRGFISLMRELVQPPAQN
jgi:hypothetical protein